VHRSSRTSTKRVLFLGTVPDRSEAALITTLAQRGLSVAGVFKRNAPRLDELRQAGVAILEIDLRQRSRRADREVIAQQLETVRPDVLHVLRSNSLGLLRTVLPAGPWPPILFYRGTLERPRWWNPAHRRKYLDPRIHLVGVSEGVRRALLSGGVEPERITVIRKGHEPHWHQAQPKSLRAELGLSAQPFLIGVIANIRWEKGVEHAVLAAEVLAQRGRDVRMVLVGADERPWWEQRLRPLARENLVIPIGLRNDVSALLPSFDVLVLPSLREGSPRVVVEAMLRDVPVVASAVGGVPELIVDGESGLLVPPRAPNEIATAVERLIDDPTLGPKMAATARRFVEDHLSVTHAAEQTLQLYDQLLSRAADVSR